MYGCSQNTSTETSVRYKKVEFSEISEEISWHVRPI